MSKTKESSGSAASGRNEGSDGLSSYIQMKSPFLGSLQFEATLPEIPVDPSLLSYEPNMDAIEYEPSGFELSERLTAFHEFDRGVQCKAWDGICYAGVGIEDPALLSQLEEEVAKLQVPDLRSRMLELRNEMMDTPEMRLMRPFLSKACEGLPDNVQNLLFMTEENNISPREAGRLPIHQRDSAGPVNHGEALREKWSRMSLDERSDHYIAHINETFVPAESLQHPTNPNAKIAKIYKIMPNVGLWKNRYIQAGIEGGASASAANASANLEVGSILNVAKDGATQRIFEYYKRAADDAEGNTKNETKEQERFTFVRMYSCQHSTKTAGNDNYFLLSLPPRLHNKLKSKLSCENESRQWDDGMTVDDPQEEDVVDSVVHILSVKGQKLVLTRAGKAKRPDIMVIYTDDTS